MKHLITLSVLFFSVIRPHAQTQDWTIYNTANSSLPDNQIQAIAIDKKNVKWIGTTKGLARFDGTEWTIYNPVNSGLPSSVIRTIAIDNHQHIWIGTDKGLAKFDGTRWSVYDSQNSILSNDAITTIINDEKSGNLWIGTEKGLIKYDQLNWTRFDENNSEILNDFICSVAVDKEGVVWVGTFDHFKFAGRLNKFDGLNWTRMRLEDKNLNSSFPNTLIIDSENIIWMGVKGTMGGALVRIQGNNWEIHDNHNSGHVFGGIQSIMIEGNLKWMGGGGGLISYNGKDFKNFTTTNSRLPDNWVYTIAIDKKGAKWLGTISGGLAVYKENSIDMPNEANTTFLKVYPNPLKSFANISYHILEKGHITIGIYSAAGHLVEVIQDKIMMQGNHTITWSPGYLPNAIYFCIVRQDKKILSKKLLLKQS